MFLLPIFAFILLFLITLTYSNSVRRDLLTAIIIWGLILVIMTELLSLFHFVTINGLVLSWWIVISVSFIFLCFRIRKLWIANSDFLFDNDEHKQDIRRSIYALTCLHIPVFFISLPAFVPLFHNIYDQLCEYFHGGEEGRDP